jgi:lipoprotein signal peptidase
MIHVGLRTAAPLLAAWRAPVATLAGTTAAVVLIDEASKALALQLLPELDAAPTRFLQLGLLHNTELAGGLSLGVESAAFSAIAALIVLGLALLVCAPLAAYDRAAPSMLGLIVGAGIANATDAFLPPAGVVDWIAVGVDNGVVLNFADVAVLVGLGLCARTVWRLLRAMRGPRSA